MAEEQQNKNSKGIGELFVEFGTKGFPTMLKQLNGISASFLLGKNAASQFAQTLTKPFKEAGNTAVNIGRLANSLDTTLQNAMKLRNYMKSYGLGESLIGELEGFQTAWRDAIQNFEDMPAGLAQALGSIGMLADMDKYTDSYEDMLKFLDEINARTQDDKHLRNQILDWMGLSRDWGYLWDRGGNLSDSFALDDSTIEKNIEAAKAVNDLFIAFETLRDLIVSKFVPPLTDFVKWFTEVTKNIISGNKSQNEIVDEISKGVENNAGKIGVAVGATVNPLAGAAIVGAGNLAREQRNVGGKTGKIVNTQFGGAQMDWGTAPWIKSKGAATGGAAPLTPDFMDISNGYVPSGMANITQNITITNQNRIQGTNGEEIVRSLSTMNSQDINLQTYEVANLAGR